MFSMRLATEEGDDVDDDAESVGLRCSGRLNVGLANDDLLAVRVERND